jgi:purine-nucleoside phosphorylase
MSLKGVITALSIIPETLPRRVILTDDPLRAKMLSAHHLEYSTLVCQLGDILIFSGNYKNAVIALVSAGFGRSAVLSCLRLIEGLGVAELIFIGGCVSTICQAATEQPGLQTVVLAAMGSQSISSQGVADSPRLRAVILAAGGSESLSGRAFRAAKQYDIPITTRAVLPNDAAHPEEGCIIDDITGVLYGQAQASGIEALSVLTLSENKKTGEKIEEHEKRSRFYAAASLVFETFAIN